MYALLLLPQPPPRVAETVEVDPRFRRLAAGGGDDALIALAIEERNLPVLAEEAVAVGVDSRCGRSLPFRQDVTASVVEVGRRSAAGARDMAFDSVDIGKPERCLPLESSPLAHRSDYRRQIDEQERPSPVES